MAIIKCKMCGGDLVLIPGSTVSECEYCGTRQTVPNADNAKKLALFARANQLRAACEFDKAAGLYEAVLAEFSREAESYWGLVLCKYGIEYVDDPATGKKIPTCHRSSYVAVTDDDDFRLAMEYADEEARVVYLREAEQIEQIRQGILKVSSSEKSYDIFICYKETDANGDRTVDSLLAQDIYEALTGIGYRVFFSRITLQDKLGQAYEPYIFAALNSARIMLAVGTCHAHYNAVWVKNEWSRYLKLIAQDKEKYLIPCYKNMNVREIPREFAYLQGQDMGKVGAIADLLRGVENLMGHDRKTVAPSRGKATSQSLLKRAYIFLEDGIWDSADAYCEKVLDLEPENAEAYLGKLLAEFRIPGTAALGNCSADLTASDNYRKALRFGDERIRGILTGTEKNSCSDSFAQTPGETVLSHQESKMDGTDRKRKKVRKPWLMASALAALIIPAMLLLNPAGGAKGDRQNESAMMETQHTASDRYSDEQYQAAVALMEEQQYEDALEAFASLSGYKDSDELWQDCRTALENTSLEESYQAAAALEQGGEYGKAAVAFGKLNGYQDSRERSLRMWEYVPGRNTVSWWVTRWIYVLHALREDGTVAVDTADADRFSEEDISAYYTADYRDIVSIHGLVGLRNDGTLALPDPDKTYQLDCNGRTEEQIYLQTLYQNCVEKHRPVLSQWTDIVSLSVCTADDQYSVFVGLKSDGSVVSAGADAHIAEQLDTWKDITAVSVSDSHVVGLKSDGTVVAAGNNEDGQCNVSDWTDIKAVLADDETTGGSDGSLRHHGMTFGLKKDGTVVAVGSNYTGAVVKVSSWKNIETLVSGKWSGRLCGITEDGNVVCTTGGAGSLLREKITHAAIIGTQSVGVTAEGTLVFDGFETDAFARARNWTDIKLPADEASDPE